MGYRFAKFGDPRQFGFGDVIFLVCHVILKHYVIKRVM